MLQPVTKAATVPKRAAVNATPVEGNADKEMVITKVQPLQNRALIGYLEKRGVPLEVATPYVQEMYYRRNDKPYFALVFANDSGGYELRNPYFQGVMGAKDITLLMKRKNESQTVAVFEGFIDMLSALCVYEKEIEGMALLVLNSTAIQDKAINTIQEIGAHQVHLFLDLDASGQQTAETFKTQLSGVEVMDESRRYENYKDVNEWWINQTREKGRG